MRQTPRPTYIGPCFYRSVNAASSRLNELYTAGLDGTGLHPLEFSILADLSRNETRSVGDLTEVFCVDRATLKYRLRPLEDAGFVVVDQDPDDRRARRIRLTPAGQQKFLEARPRWQEAQRRFEAVIGDEAAASFRLRAQAVASRKFKTEFESA